MTTLSTALSSTSISSLLSASTTASTTLSTSATPVIPATPTESDNPSVTGTIYPGNSKYQYYGCYNETTQVNVTGGKRALGGGSMESLTSMTVETCLSYCNMDGFTYAGLEYEKECWCAPYLSVFSQKLPDSACNYACKGNSSQLCGAPLVLSVYRKVVSQANPALRARNIPTTVFIMGLVVLGLFLQS